MSLYQIRKAIELQNGSSGRVFSNGRLTRDELGNCPTTGRGVQRQSAVGMEPQNEINGCNMDNMNDMNQTGREENVQIPPFPILEL